MSDEMNLTRRTLIQRIKDPNDSSAWEEFQDFYWNLIVGWAKMFGCSDTLAKDVFQETMINLFKNMPDFVYNPQKGCFRSYLKTIVSRRVKDAFRRESRYVTQHALDDDDAGAGTFQELAEPGPEHDVNMDILWIHNILSQAMRQASKTVTPLTYKSFCLHVLDGLPVNDVAEKLGIDRERTIYEHKRRFIEILQREFNQLLEDFNDTESALSDSVSRNSLFTKALEDFLANRRECRDTVISKIAPHGLLDQIKFVSDTLAKATPPEDAGAYLLACASLEQPAQSDSLQWHRLKDEFRIGRLDSCDLILAAEKISGLHATIQHQQDTWTILDENSTNGVYVNGKRITQPCYLKRGDIIQITDQYQYIFFGEAG